MNKQVKVNQMVSETNVKEITPMEAAKSLVEIELKIKALEKEKEEYKKHLMEVMKQNDTFSLRTGSYTLTRQEKITPKVINVERLKTELDKREIPYYTEEAFSSSMYFVFRELAKKDQEIKDFGLPGLEISATEYVSVRVTKK